MLDIRRYVPILKGRAGEFGALRSMSAEEKVLVTPLVEIPPIPWDYGADSPAKTIDAHLAKVDDNLVKSWGLQQDFFVDLMWVGDGERMSDGSHPMDCLFGKMRGRGLKAVPVTGLVRNKQYQKACKKATSTDGRGACLRLQVEDFEDITGLGDEIFAVLESLEISPGETDILLDLGSLLAEEGKRELADVLVMVGSIPRLKAWRSFIIAGTGFPVDLIGLPPEGVSMVPRAEWDLWRKVAASPRALRAPTFADYAIAHPQPPEVDPRIMRPSASIRYTTDESWLVLKGRNLKDHGYRQFHDVSRALVRNPAYVGPDFSWGDRYISDCARRRAGTGNLTTWRKVGTSHHLSFVTRQISSFPSP